MNEGERIRNSIDNAEAEHDRAYREMVRVYRESSDKGKDMMRKRYGISEIPTSPGKPMLVIHGLAVDTWRSDTNQA